MISKHQSLVDSGLYTYFNTAEKIIVAVPTSLVPVMSTNALYITDEQLAVQLKNMTNVNTQTFQSRQNVHAVVGKFMDNYQIKYFINEYVEIEAAVKTMYAMDIVKSIYGVIPTVIRELTGQFTKAKQFTE